MSEYGPTGPQGVQGIQGITGPQGIQGIQGIQGQQGFQGQAGSQGLPGNTGPQGIMGSTGPQGYIGYTGPQGPYGNTGPQGPVGPQGPNSGLTGPTGSNSLWISNTGNMYFIPASGSTGIGINTTRPNYTLDISGSLNVSSIANIVRTIYLSNISEKIHNAVYSGTANTYNLDYAQSSIFFISNTPSATGLMTYNLFNLPTITDPSHSIIVSVIYKGTGSNYYANSVNLSTTTTISGSNFVPSFTSTPSIASIPNTKLVVQQITYLYLGGQGYIISNVNGYAS